jgi:hypothetical protein
MLILLHLIEQTGPKHFQTLGFILVL